jgi:hypothetical protein
VSSALLRRTLPAERAVPADPRVVGEWLQRKFRRVAHPSWLAAIGVGLVSAVMVVGWPEAAGSATRSLLLGAGLTSALAALVLATQQAGLRHRIRELRRAGHYQGLALEFSTRSLAWNDVRSVLQEATTFIATSLGLECCAVLESVADAEGALVLRAGVGWPAGSLDCRVVSEDGSCIRADHFVTGVWEHENGVGSGVSVRLQAGNRAYGLLDMCTSSQRVFCSEELAFIDSMRRLLSAAIDRDRTPGTNGTSNSRNGASSGPAYADSNDRDVR